MNGIVNAAYAVERLKILAEQVVEVASSLREAHPEEYEKREEIGMFEHVAAILLESGREV